MATYAIGDLQGCFEPLQELLQKISFNTTKDKLWFVGDLVNRGPDSLETLRFVKSLVEQGCAITVLGNHDLHLLAVYYGFEKKSIKDNFKDVLDSPDCDELCNWLRRQPIFYHDMELNFSLVHAGFPPQWLLAQAKRYAREVEEILQGPNAEELFQHMYGDLPNLWDEQLQGWERTRLIVNCFTRIRYCDEEGRLELKDKGPLGTQKKGLLPWFLINERKTKGENLVFGHWASLVDHWDEITESGIYPLDSGCVWGNRLTAMRLEDCKRFDVPCG